MRAAGRCAVPWCEACDLRLEDDQLAGDGTCPQCGGTPAEHRPSPWYFKFMLVATVVYLGWRAYQGVGWLIHHV